MLKFDLTDHYIVALPVKFGCLELAAENGLFVVKSGVGLIKNVNRVSKKGQPAKGSAPLVEPNKRGFKDSSFTVGF